VQTLLNLLAAVALLVWGTHIVRTGVMRVFGADLRRVLGRSVSNRFKAFGAGLGVTAVVQSSTATAMLTTSFVGQGLIATAPALAVMLGADVGTALVAQFFSLDLGWLSPLLILCGVVLFLSQQNKTAGRLGRVAIGLGLIMLALRLITETAAPLTQAAEVRVLFSTLTGDHGLDMLLGALLTLAAYSSLAIVLLVSTFAAASLISPEVAIGLVLGANLGAGLLAVSASLRAGVAARRVALGNLGFKVFGCVAALIALDPLLAWLAAFDANAARMVLNFHLGFNLFLAAVFIAWIGPIGRLLDRLLPTPAATGNEASAPRYLDAVALQTPTLAIACAAREALRLGDLIESMLKNLLLLLRDNDNSAAQQLRRADDDVDRLYTAIKLYLTQISREALAEKEARRWAEIMSITINLEHVGDIVDKNLLEMAEKKIRKRLSFSDAGIAEICELHARVIANLQLGLNVFVTGDLAAARRLLAEKEQIRDLERTYAETHLKRLSDNTVQSIETSALHLDIIRDLKRINSHIASIAYPILEEAGALAPTRLRPMDAPIRPQADLPPHKSS
jgi:phosphate:Na+ symporter